MQSENKAGVEEDQQRIIKELVAQASSKLTTGEQEQLLVMLASMHSLLAIGLVRKMFARLDTHVHWFSHFQPGGSYNSLTLWAYLDRRHDH